MKERLIYFDAARGIAMLLIVCAHTGVCIPIIMLDSAKVVVFFLISGIFFSDKLPLKDYLNRNYKRLIIPFLFFYIISYGFFYLGQYLIPGFESMTTAEGIWDCFNQKQYFNGPIWFLLSLFWMMMIQYAISKTISKKLTQAIVALGCGFLGFMMNVKEYDLPLNIDTALTFTPVFYFGRLVKMFALNERYNKVESTIFSCIFYMSCIPISMTVEDSLNRYGGGWVFSVTLFLHNT